MNKERMNQSVPKLVAVIVDRDNAGRVEEILREKRVHFHYMLSGSGTASSEILKYLGLSGTQKTACICIVPSVTALPLVKSLTDRLTLTRSGNGIAFIIPISGVGAHISSSLEKEFEHIKERMDSWMDAGYEEIKEEAGYSLVVSVINKGFSETLMEAARGVGARGGTIISARRSDIEDAVKFFGVTLQAEKEIVAIVVPKTQKKELMRVITKKCGINTEAHGIVMALPVEYCAGITPEID